MTTNNGTVTVKHHNWIPACGGTEVPFVTRTGWKVQYLWCPATGEHAYYCFDNDLFIGNDEMVKYGLLW